MACGAPAIVSNRASLPEVAGDAALLVDPASIDAIRAALHSALSDRGLREDLRRRSLARAERFRGDGSVQRVLEILRAAERG
jgi:glycosyltransferase involved in cell wall biosynthesis